MSKHVTYRGITIDMDSIVRENEKSIAVGNMRANAKGDMLGRGKVVTKTADQIARENHRTQTTVVRAGLKGPLPAAEAPLFDAKELSATKPAKTKNKEVELPSGDIIIKDEK